MLEGCSMLADYTYIHDMTHFERYGDSKPLFEKYPSLLNTCRTLSPRVMFR